MPEPTPRDTSPAAPLPQAGPDAPGGAPGTEPVAQDEPAFEGYEDFAGEISDQVDSFLLAVREVARGEDPGATLSLLLLQTGQIALAGARLGAIGDVVLAEPFEPDPGYDPDLEQLREHLQVLLDPVDDFVEILDPVDPTRGADTFLMSDELASVCGDLLHGAQHYRAGRVIEALWWWQFSYLSSWGPSITAVHRGLHSLIAHTRLDSVHDATTDAEDRLLADVVAEATGAT